MMKRFFATMLLTAFFWACTESNPELTGATSETTNGIAFIVVDASHTPVANARIKLYSKENISVIDSAATNSLGEAHFDTVISDGFIEGIAGNDSSLMVWEPLDTNQTRISLLPAASITVRTGAAEADYAKLYETIALQSTPYAATRNGNEYVFSRVPAGTFDIVAGDSLIATVSLENGTTADTLFRMPGITQEFVFEDFEDGDSLNNIAKTIPNYGWYFNASNDAKWITPDSSNKFATAISGDEHGKYISLKFALGDSGYVLLGTHIGLDTGYYDLSKLTAVRMKVRGDCEFSVALEHYKDVGNNKFRKALWKSKASEDWHEIVIRPGNETLESESYQVRFSEIAKEIGLFSIFVSSGTFLQIDEIVFEGMNSITEL
ncbi:MAG: hypothetical protein IJ908_09360 [Fibrobacter sp.]|nr:hypothetical protein [Fibrobacter sp.]